MLMFSAERGDLLTAGSPVTLTFVLTNVGAITLFNTTVNANGVEDVQCFNNTGNISSVIEPGTQLLCRCVQ